MHAVASTISCTCDSIHWWSRPLFYNCLSCNSQKVMNEREDATIYYACTILKSLQDIESNPTLFPYVILYYIISNTTYVTFIILTVQMTGSLWQCMNQISIIIMLWSIISSNRQKWLIKLVRFLCLLICASCRYLCNSWYLFLHKQSTEIKIDSTKSIATIYWPID